MTEKYTKLVLKKMKPKYEEIIAFTDKVCKEHLNEDYAELCQKMTAQLASSEDSPLNKGKADTCSITYALGKINFLFDKSQALNWVKRLANLLCAELQYYLLYKTVA